MEDILNYNKRDQLYEFLIKDFGLVKVEEGYDAKVFGNFFVTLSAKHFSLRYINDRSYLTIEISSHFDPSKWYDLSFIRNFIYHADAINSEDRSIDNIARIEELNAFLRKELELINDLFNDDNYKDTKYKIDELLRKQFNQRFPGMIK